MDIVVEISGGGTKLQESQASRESERAGRERGRRKGKKGKRGNGKGSGLANEHAAAKFRRKDKNVSESVER